MVARSGRLLRRSAFSRRLSLAVLAPLLLAACGSSAPSSFGGRTPVASGARSAAAILSPAPSPAPSPSATIVPVPTLQLAAPSSAPPARLDPALAADLQRTLDALRTSGGFPGMAAAVVFPGGEVWSGAAGLALRSPARPMTVHTVFSVASITKTFVSALALRLVERGRLSLDDPLSRWLPSFPDARQITIRQLLSHTSGVQDLFAAPGLGAAILDDPGRIWTPAEVLARIGRPYFAPGSGYHYSNTNYILLGLILEKIAGRSLAGQIRDEFLTPLGLRDTSFQTEEPLVGQAAHGYVGTAASPRDVSAGQRLIPFNAETSAAGASGAMASSAVDLAAWAAALYGGGLLEESSLAAMIDVSPTAPYKPAHLYGLGLEEASLAGHLGWGHRGHLDGFWSSMSYLPDVHLCVVVLVNAEWVDPLAPSARLVSVALSGR